MNSNSAVNGFLHGEAFAPRDPMKTLSSAMDVGNPSNIERLATFYKEAPAVMRNMVFPETVNDEDTMKAMKEAYDRYGLLLDPHGAVGYAAARRALVGDLEFGHAVVVSTGHPAKHAAVVEKATGQRVEVPDALRDLSRIVPPVATINPPALRRLKPR